MSIGSVPPNGNVNCVRNVTFDQIHFKNSLKAVHIKSNPGNSGSGLIEGITYSNIVVDGILWYGVWIGPQQQDQPGDKNGGTGCSFLYPLKGQKCPTQPLVTIRDISLVNITFKNPWLTGVPGVIHGDHKNPFQNIVFDNVQTSGLFVLEKHFICDGASGTSKNSNLVPSCLKEVK